MAFPTVVMGLGPFGDELAGRVVQGLSDEGTLVRALRGDASQLVAALPACLDELLRAGRASEGRSDVRLDLFVGVDLASVDEAQLVGLCDGVAKVLGERYGVLFPPDAPPEQRGATMHLLCASPPLGPRPDAAAAMRKLSAVESLSSAARGYPLLSRAWLLSPHTTAGTLSDEGVLSSLASFAIACVSMRETDEVRERMAHHGRGEGKVSLLSVASLDVPEAKLRRYARARAAYDAFVTLSERLSRHVPDQAAAEQAIEALEAGRFLEAFEQGEAAARLRKVSASLSGAPDAVDERVEVGPFDDAATIRGRHPSLFRPATEGKAQSPVDSVSLNEALRALDQAESEAAARVPRGVEALFARALGPTTGLRRLPEVELGLRMLVARLKLDDEGDREGLEGSSQGQGEGDEPRLRELEEAMLSLPSTGVLRGASLSAGVAAGAVATALTMRATARPASAAPSQLSQVVVASASAQPATSASTQGADPPPFVAPGRDDVAPFAVGLVVLFVAFGLCMYVLGNSARQQVREALTRRRDELAELLRRGGAGAARAQADGQLRLRRRRVRRAAVTAIEQAQARLSAARGAVLDARELALQTLRDMGIKAPAPAAAADDVGPLFGTRELLHDALVSPQRLADWAARRREVPDAEPWADRVVERTYPQRGLADDVPCADRDRIDALCREQVRPLVEQSLLADPDILREAAQSVHLFAQRATTALAPSVQPRDDRGDLSPGVRPGHLFVVAPRIGAPELGPALGRAPFAISPIYSEARAARVLFVRTWEGYTVADIARGARVFDAQPPARLA